MLIAVQEAFNRVFGRDVLLRADTPLSSLGNWNDYAPLIAMALKESTGVALTDPQLSASTTVGELVLVLGESAA